MIKRDYHGYKLDEALNDFECIVNQVRMCGESEELTIVTGHGVIQKEIMSLCEKLRIHATVSWTNSGAINMFID